MYPSVQFKSLFFFSLSITAHCNQVLFLPSLRSGLMYIKFKWVLIIGFNWVLIIARFVSDLIVFDFVNQSCFHFHVTIYCQTNNFAVGCWFPWCSLYYVLCMLSPKFQQLLRMCVKCMIYTMIQYSRPHVFPSSPQLHHNSHRSDEVSWWGVRFWSELPWSRRKNTIVGQTITILNRIKLLNSSHGHPAQSCVSVVQGKKRKMAWCIIYQCIRCVELPQWVTFSKIKKNLALLHCVSCTSWTVTLKDIPIYVNKWLLWEVFQSVKWQASVFTCVIQEEEDW